MAKLLKIVLVAANISQCTDINTEFRSLDIMVSCQNIIITACELENNQTRKTSKVASTWGLMGPNGYELKRNQGEFIPL